MMTLPKRHTILACMMLIVTIFLGATPLLAASKVPKALKAVTKVQRTTDMDLIVYVNGAVRTIYSMDFVNYRRNLREASYYFTTQAWQAFLHSLKQTNTIADVRARRLVISAVAAAPPVMLAKQEMKDTNTSTWDLQLPIRIRYQTATSTTVKKVLLQIKIVKSTQKQDQCPMGMCISQLLVKQFLEK